MFNRMAVCFDLLILKYFVMVYICSYDSTSDISQVVPGLAPDLDLAIREGVVLDTAMNPEYNSIDDPVNIVGRVRDVFDAVEYQRSVAKSIKSSQSAAANPSVEQAPAGEKS